MQKQYDGELLVADSYTVKGLAKGHTIQLTVNGSQTDIGSSLNTVDASSIVILDKDGKECTQFYKINLSYGILTVNYAG